MNKFFNNKKMLWSLFFICLLLTIWILLLKLCIPGRIHFNDVHSMSVEEWFWFGINPEKSLAISCQTPLRLREYILEQTVNVVCLIPFGILAPFVMKKWKALLFGVLLTVAIEFTQLFCRIGGFDIIDMGTNTLGVIIGILLQWIWLGRLSSVTINKLCKIFLAISVPVAIYAIYTIIFVFPGTLPV